MEIRGRILKRALGRPEFRAVRLLMAWHSGAVLHAARLGGFAASLWAGRQGPELRGDR